MEKKRLWGIATWPPGIDISIAEKEKLRIIHFGFTTNPGSGCIKVNEANIHVYKKNNSYG